jgi:hypothetical protein
MATGALGVAFQDQVLCRGFAAALPVHRPHAPRLRRGPRARGTRQTTVARLSFLSP